MYSEVTQVTLRKSGVSQRECGPVRLGEITQNTLRQRQFAVQLITVCGRFLRSITLVQTRFR